MNNKELVTAKLGELAAKVEVMEKGPTVRFKRGAYLKAAKAISTLPGDLTSINELDGIPGIGESIRAKITEILATGTLHKLDDFKNDPSDLLRIDGVGPVGARELLNLYGHRTVEGLGQAIKGGLEVDPKLAQGVRNALAIDGKPRPRAELIEIVDDLMLAFRLKVPRAIIQLAGSIRRLKQLCRDVDIVFAGSTQDIAGGRLVFLGQPWDLVIEEGPTRCRCVLKGVKVDIRFVSREEYGSTLLYFTGPKLLNGQMRGLAKSRGLKLSEYGLTRLSDGAVLAREREEDIFMALGLPWMEPEDRENGLTPSMPSDTVGP